MSDLITEDLLGAVMNHARPEDIADFVGPLNVAAQEYGIDTPGRLAAFLAQVTVESDHLWHARAHYGTERGEEYASGEAYEGRHDLGNVQPGDGVRFKGRGLVQVTGRANYARVSAALGVDFVANPDLLLDPKRASLSAAYFWKSHGLNELADGGDFVAITKRINGGLLGEERREAAHGRAENALT